MWCAASLNRLCGADPPPVANVHSCLLPTCDRKPTALRPSAPPHTPQRPLRHEPGAQITPTSWTKSCAQDPRPARTAASSHEHEILPPYYGWAAARVHLSKDSICGKNSVARPTCTRARRRFWTSHCQTPIAGPQSPPPCKRAGASVQNLSRGAEIWQTDRTCPTDRAGPDFPPPKSPTTRSGSASAPAGPGMRRPFPCEPRQPILVTTGQQSSPKLPFLAPSRLTRPPPRLGCKALAAVN